MLSDQQDSGGLSCLPSPRATGSVSVMSTVALGDSLSSRSPSSASSSALSFSGASTSTASSHHLEPNHQDNSAGAGAATAGAAADASASLQLATPVAVNLPVFQCCTAGATASAASPLQSNGLGASATGVSPSTTSSGASPAYPSAVLRPSNDPHISTRPPCGPPPRPSTFSGGSFRLPGHATVEHYTAADFDVRADFGTAAAAADYSSEPSSKYSTAPAYSSTSASECSPTDAADYKSAAPTSYCTGAAPGIDYGPLPPAAAAAEKLGPAVSPSAADFRNNPSQQLQPRPSHEELWQRPNQRLLNPPSQSYQRGTHVPPQRLYLPQAELQKQQQHQLTPAHERLPQLQPQRQHFEQSSPALHLGAQYDSLQVSQVQLLEHQYTMQQEQHMQRVAEGTVGLISAEAVSVTEPGKSNGQGVLESTCTPQRQSTNSSTSCLYASQTTASSLSASCVSAQSHSAVGSPSTHTQQLCNSTYIRTPVNNYDASAATSTAPALTTHGGWSSLQPSPRCYSTYEAHNLSKPAAALADPCVLPTAVPTSLHDRSDAPPTVLRMLSTVSSSRACTQLQSTRTETAAATAPSVTAGAASAFASGGAPRGVDLASPMTDYAPAARHTAECVSFDEAALYHNVPSHGYSSGTPTNTSFEDHQQWQQTRLSLGASQSTVVASPASSAAATAQPPLLPQQQVHPLLQPRQQQRAQQQQFGQSPKHQKLRDTTQPHPGLQVSKQQQLLQSRQRLQAHLPSQQQQRLQQMSPPSVTLQLLQHVRQPQYMQQDDPQAGLLQQRAQQQQRQPANSGQALCQPPELHQHGLHQSQLQHQIPKHPLQQQHLGLQQHYLQSQQVSGSHCAPPPQQTNTTLTSIGPYSCSTRQVSSLPLEAGSVTPYPQQTISVASAAYSARTTSPPGVAKSNPSSRSVHPVPDIEAGASASYVQSQQPPEQQRFPQIQQQQQLLQLQTQQEHLHQQQLLQQQQQRQLVGGQSGDIASSSPNRGLPDAEAGLKRQRQQQVQHNGLQTMRPDSHPQQEPHDTPQQDHNCQQHEKLNPDNLSPLRTPFAQGHSRVDSIRPQLSLTSSPRYLVPPPSRPAAYSPSSTVSPSCVSPISSGDPATSIRSTTFSEVSNESLSSARSALLLPSGPPQSQVSATLLSSGSRSRAIPTAAAAVQAEHIVAAAGKNSPAVGGIAVDAAGSAVSPAFSTAFPGYATSIGADVEPPLGRHAPPPSLSLTAGRGVSPACFLTVAAGSAPDCTGFRGSGDVHQANTACCIPVGCGSQTDNWGSVQRGGNSSAMKNSAKRGATPQQKSSSRRCPQHRHQQQLGTESPAVPNGNTHPLRAVRGLPIQQRKLFRHLARQTPRVQGLTFDHNQIRWISYWKNSQGKQIQRHFPVSRFGFIEARRLALEERNRILGWPLDTDEAADAIAELSRTAEQSLQLLLQQSFATGGSQHGEGKAAEVTENATLGAPAAVAAAGTESYAAEAVGETDMQATTAERSGTAGGGDGGAQAAHDTPPVAACATAVSTATTTEQQLRPAARPGAATRAGYFAQADDSYSSPQEGGGIEADVAASAAATASKATATAPTAVAATTGTTPPGGREAPTGKEERSLPPAGGDPSFQEAIHLCYVASEGVYPACACTFREEMATDALEKREALLQYPQQHRTSVISASTTDQERTHDAAPQATSHAPLGPTSNHAAAGHTPAYSTAATADIGKTRAASSTYNEAFTQQRDRSAASTNVEEDAEAAASVLEDSMHTTKQQQRQEQQKWMQRYEEQQQQYQSTEETYAMTNNSNQLELPDDLTQKQRLQQQQQQYTSQDQHHPSQSGDTLPDKEWPIQTQPPQQPGLQHEGGTVQNRTGCIDSSNVSRDSDALKATAAMESSVLGAERQSSKPCESLPQRITGNSDGETSSSIQHRENQQQSYFLSRAPPPVQQEQQHLQHLTQQQHQPDNNSEFFDSPKQWKGMGKSRQVAFVSQESPSICRTATAVAKSRTNARLSNILAAGGPPSFDAANVFDAGTGVSASPAPTTTSVTSGDVLTAGPTVSEMPSAFSASITPACNKQQPRQRSRLRKKKSEAAFTCSGSQQSPATAVAAAAPEVAAAATAPVAAQTSLPGLTLPSVRTQNIALQTSAVAEAARGRLAPVGDTQSPPSANPNSFADPPHLTAATTTTTALMGMQQLQQESAALLTNLPGSQSGAVAADHTQQKLMVITPDYTGDGGVCSSRESSHSQQSPQQVSSAAFHNRQTLPWTGTTDALCSDWKGGQQKGQEQQQQQRGMQQDPQRDFSIAGEGQQLLQQRTEQHLSVLGKPCTSQQQPHGRQKQQRPSSKKKTVKQPGSPNSLWGKAEAEGATAAAATAAVAAAAATAVVAAATATATAAISSASASSKRKKSPEHGEDQKKGQGSSSRKARRKCEPEEQQHALFSAAAAAARQAVDTLPEPIIHPHLLQRHFPPSTLQYVQSSLQQQEQPVRSLEPEKQQQKRLQQRQQDNQQYVQKLAYKDRGNMLSCRSGGMPALVQGQEQMQDQMYCLQQPQQMPELQRTRLLAAPLRSSDNQCSSLVPTPPQTPSSAAPFDFPADSSRSNSYQRDDSRACCTNAKAASRRHLSSTSSSSNSTGTSADSSSDSIGNRHIDSSTHSTADSSAHSTVGSRISDNSVAEGGGGRQGPQIVMSCTESWVNKGESPFRKPLPLCSSCCNSGKSDRCSRCNGGPNNSCSSENWSGTTAAEATLQHEHTSSSSSKTECSVLSTAARSLVALQTAAAEDVNAKAGIVVAGPTDATMGETAVATASGTAVPAAAPGKTTSRGDTAPPKHCGEMPHCSTCSSNNDGSSIPQKSGSSLLLHPRGKERGTNSASLHPRYGCTPKPSTTDSSGDMSAPARAGGEHFVHKYDGGDGPKSKQWEGEQQPPQERDPTQAGSAARGVEQQQQTLLLERRASEKEDMQQLQTNKGGRRQQSRPSQAEAPLKDSVVALLCANISADDCGPIDEQHKGEQTRGLACFPVETSTSLQGPSQQPVMTQGATRNCGGRGITQDASGYTSPIHSTGFNSTRDDVWPSSAVSPRTFTQPASAGTCGARPGPARAGSLPVIPSCPTDIKCSGSSSTSASTATAPSSLLASGFLSASCWVGGCMSTGDGGAAAAARAATTGSERYSSNPCGQQDKEQNSPVTTPTNMAAGVAEQAELMSYRSEAPKTAEQPTSEAVWANHLRGGSCTSEEDQRARSSGFDEVSSRQQKPHQGMRPQQFPPGGGRRCSSLSCNAVNDVVSCHDGGSRDVEEKTEQQLLQRRSPCSSNNNSGAPSDQKEPGALPLSAEMESFTTVRPVQQPKQGQKQENESQEEIQHHRLQEQKHEGQQHTIMPQPVAQQPEEAEESPFLQPSQSTGAAAHTSPIMINSTFLSCAPSSKLNSYGHDSAETPLSPFAAQPTFPCTGSRSSTGCSATDLRALKSYWEGLHKGKGQLQQHQQLTGARMPSSSAAATTTASAIAAVPTPPSIAAAEPALQGYLHAPGDFFQLLPSPRRPSSDWLTCENNSFPILQPRCSRGSVTSHATTAAAAVALPSPSSASNSVSTGSDTAAVATYETYTLPASSTTPARAAAATRTAEAVNTSETAGSFPAVNVSAPTAAAGEGGNSHIRPLAPALPPEQQHSVPASCSLLLLGARGYLTPAAQDLSSMSAAVQHQQLSPLWTATVPLPALFRSSTSSSIDSFSSLPPVTTGTRRGATAAAGVTADPVGGIETVTEFGGSSISISSGVSSSLHARLKTAVPDGETSPVAATVAVKRHTDNETDSKRAPEPFWRKLVSAGEPKDVIGAEDANDRYDCRSATATTAAKHRGVATVQSNSTEARSCSVNVLSPATAALARPSHYLSGNTLLRLCTLASDPAGVSPRERRTSPPTSASGATAIASLPATAVKYASAVGADARVATVDDSTLPPTTTAAAERRGQQQRQKQREQNGEMALTGLLGKGASLEIGGEAEIRSAAGPSSGQAVPIVAETAEASAGPVGMAESATAPAHETAAEATTSTGLRGVSDQAIAGMTDVRSPLHLASVAALWRSTTATSDATHAAEEGSSFFVSNPGSSWLLNEKLGSCSALSLNADGDSSSDKDQQKTVHQAPPAGRVAASTAATRALHSCSAYKSQSSPLCCVKPPTASAAASEVAATLPSCPVTVAAAVEEGVSPSAASVAPGTQQTCFTPQQLLLSTPLFAAGGGSDELLQRRDNSLTPAAGASTWTATAAAASWTAATAGEEGWSPLLSFAAVPPSPVHAPARFLRLSSPRLSVLAPLPATAATTCSSSTTETDVGAPFSFLLGERALSTLSSGESSCTTSATAPHRQLHTDS